MNKPATLTARNEAIEAGNRFINASTDAARAKARRDLNEAAWKEGHAMSAVARKFSTSRKFELRWREATIEGSTFVPGHFEARRYGEPRGTLGTLGTVRQMKVLGTATPIPFGEFLVRQAGRGFATTSSLAEACEYLNAQD